MTLQHWQLIMQFPQSIISFNKVLALNCDPNLINVVTTVYWAARDLRYEGI